MRFVWLEAKKGDFFSRLGISPASLMGLCVRICLVESGHVFTLFQLENKRAETNEVFAQNAFFFFFALKNNFFEYFNLK